MGGGTVIESSIQNYMYNNNIIENAYLKAGAYIILTINYSNL